MTNLTELKRDDLELAARAFAAEKSVEIAGAIIAHVFLYLPIAVQHHRDAAEERASDLMRGLLKMALKDFVSRYDREREEIKKRAVELASDALARQNRTVILTRAKPVCQKCFHVHEAGTHCGVSMGGAGECDCTAEVRV